MDYWELIFSKATVLTAEPVISKKSDCFRASVVGMSIDTDDFGRLSEESIPKEYNSEPHKDTHKLLGAYTLIKYDDDDETLMRITSLIHWRRDKINVYVGGVVNGNFITMKLSPELPIVSDINHYHYFPLNK